MWAEGKLWLPGCLQLLHTDVGLHMACPSFVNTSMIRTAQKDAVMGFLLC